MTPPSKTDEMMSAKNPSALGSEEEEEDAGDGEEEEDMLRLCDEEG